MEKIDELLDIMRSLRDPENGCPWDLEQSFASIVPHTLEEAYEVADCIERHDYAHLPAELGDLLFQVVFYAQLGREQDLFDFDHVVAAIAEKLVRRHPHVFADSSVIDAADQTRRWEAQKAAERAAADDGRNASALAGVPLGLPALTRARKLQQRAARVGFDWPNVAGVKAKVIEETAELEAAVAHATKVEVEEEMGDLLFASVNWARHLGVDPETALRAASRKFERRFHYIEAALAAAGTETTQASLAEMDELWHAAKIAERAPDDPTGKKKRVRKHP